MIRIWIDLLFTMSENTQIARIPGILTNEGCETIANCYLADDWRRAAGQTKHLVEPDGIEPTTSCLQSTRSPS